MTLPPRRLLALLALAAAAPLAARPAPEATFDAVAKDHDARTQRFHRNTRVTGTVRIYAVEWKDGRGSSTLGAEFDFEEVYDAAGNARGTITDSRLDTRKTGTGSYLTPEIAYAVSRDKTGYAVRDFVPRRDSEFDYLRRASVGPGGMPLSFDGRRSTELVTYVLAGKGNLTHTLALEPATRTTKDGKDVLAVPSTLTPRGGASAGVIRQTSYFDPANAHAFLGAESEEPPDHSQQRPWASRQTCVLEYAPRADGPPVPKRFTRHVRPEKGDPLLEYEADYTRFESYTPTADDFRLEGRYNLPTPTGPDDKPRPAAPPPESRAWVWVAVAAGVVVVVLAGVVVYRRRRAARLRGPG